MRHLARFSASACGHHYVRFEIEDFVFKTFSGIQEYTIVYVIYYFQGKRRRYNYRIKVIYVHSFYGATFIHCFK
jgi:hypothetical protein